jgi:hypothetical protein
MASPGHAEDLDRQTGDEVEMIAGLSSEDCHLAIFGMSLPGDETIIARWDHPHLVVSKVETNIVFGSGARLPRITMAGLDLLMAEMVEDTEAQVREDSMTKLLCRYPGEI